MNHNAINLQLALDWLHAIIKNRLNKNADDFTVDPLEFYNEDFGLAGFIATHNPDYEEFVLLMLALAPSQVGYAVRTIFRTNNDFWYFKPTSIVH